MLAVLFCTALLFAADAQASGGTPDGATDTAIGEAAPPTTEQAPPAAGQSTGAESVSTVGQSSPTTEQSPPATEQPTAPIEVSPPAAETTPPPAEYSPPAGETAPVVPPPVELPPVVVETPPTVEQQQPVAKEPSLVEESSPVVDKKTTEQSAGDVAVEARSEVIQGSEEGSQAPVDTSGPIHKDAAASEVAPAAAVPAAAPTAPAVLSESSMPSTQEQSSLAFPAPSTLVHSAGQASCELAPFGASIAARGVHGLLAISTGTPVSTGSLTTVEASPTGTTAGGSTGGGGFLVGHPSPPTPGPGSGGAGSGSAAGGGSGSASSAPFTLVGALLQAAPRAMRRLLLAQQSWRTSFLVLIPERPD
jgi:hypothetical protein